LEWRDGSRRRRLREREGEAVYGAVGFSCRRCGWPLVWLAAAVSLCGLGCRGTGPEESEGAERPGRPVPVQVAVAQTKTLRPSVQLVGTLEPIPERTADVSLRVDGWVDQVLVVEGQSVRAGQELLRLDPRVAEVELARAEATVQQKRAVWERLKHGYLPQEIEEARQRARETRQTLESLKVEFAALESLYKKNEVSAVQYRAALAKLRAAEAAAEAAEARRKLLEAGTRPEQVEEAKADLAVAEAERDAARLNLAFCSVTTPIAGLVTKLEARRGAFLQRASPVATVVDVSELFAKVHVPSQQYAQLEPGQSADVRLPALPGQVFRGTVDRVSGQADPASGHTDAYVRIRNRDSLLRPGMACRVTVWLPERRNVLAIPVAAVADHSGRSVVTLVRDGKAFEVEVRLGAEADGEVEVLAGLKPGDVVATKGGYGLPDGCPVRVVEAGPTPSE